MAQESAFFNAELDGEEYDRVYLAERFAAYFASFIGNGVYADSMQELEVAAQATPNMSVQILPGQGWINGYWYRNTSAYTLAIDPADGTLGRIDRIVLRWDQEERDIYLAVIKGTTSANPVAPAIVRDSDYYDLCLANLNIIAGLTSITQSAITDTRADSSVCGWVTGVIDQIDLTDLYNQFETFFQEFKENNVADYESWTADQKSDYEAWVAAQKNIYLNWINGAESDFDTWKENFETAASTWYSESQNEFEEWFENLQDILDTDVAGHLQNEIEELQNDVGETTDLLGSVAEMLIKNRIHAPAQLSNGNLLQLSDGSLLEFQWSYAYADVLAQTEN